MKRKTRSYFKKVKRGELTVENAAEKLGCPCYQFRKEFEKYYDPFSESSHGFRILDGVTILTFFDYNIIYF